MSYTQAQMDQLDADMAAAGINQEVRYADGTQLRRMAMADALKLRELMRMEIQAAAENTPTPVRAFRGVLRGGY